MVYWNQQCCESSYNYTLAWIDHWGVNTMQCIQGKAACLRSTHTRASCEAFLSQMPLERLSWLALVRCTVLIRGNFSSVRNLIQLGQPVYMYAVIASSPGPFPAFQWYTLKLKNLEEPSWGWGYTMMSYYITLSYMHMYQMLSILSTGISQHLEIKRHWFFICELEIWSG